MQPGGQESHLVILLSLMSENPVLHKKQTDKEPYEQD